jgi:hypothetical protein
MTAQPDNLTAAVAELEQAAADWEAGRGSEPAWRLERALAVVELALREHQQSLDPDGQVVEVDSPRIPSPTVDRQVEGLHHELHALLGEIRSLREQLAAGPAPPTGRLREWVRQLLAALSHYGEEEARVIQEALNTDVGAGD